MLVDLYDRCIEVDTTAQPECVWFPLSQEEVADYAGITLVHVSRVIKALRDQGVLENGHRKIRILDTGALCKTANMSARADRRNFQT